MTNNPFTGRDGYFQRLRCLGHTTEDLARLLALPPSTVIRILHGSLAPVADEIRAMARFVHCSFTEVLAGLPTAAERRAQAAAIRYTTDQVQAGSRRFRYPRALRARLSKLSRVPLRRAK